MKFSTVFCLLSVFALTSCEDQIPKQLEKLMSSNLEVKSYQRFDEINAVKPVPAKLNLGVGAIFSMAVLGKKSINYSILESNQYSLLENRINVFFEHPGLQRSLRLLSYARQLKSGHPYRVNPFVPYMTLRKENSLLADQKVGPAAVVHELFKQKGPYQGNISFVDYDGNKFKFDVKFSPKSLDRSGIMFLFDHQLFSMDDLIRDPEKNILQDVIVHEFTHIWHNEVISSSARDRHNVESNSTENGHDTMIVSNPDLAFGEGLAEAFEALYGTTASQLINMSESERRQFFGRFTGKVAKEIEFLINRQGYIRRNVYLYNLYDFKKCTLRIISGMDSSEVGGRGLSPEEMVNRMMNGENVDINKWLSTFDWEDFSDRFYGTGNRVSTNLLKDNCQSDPWQRLESKEGFVATMIYNLLYSGAMVDSSYYEKSLGINFQKKKTPWMNKYVSATQEWNKVWSKWVKDSGMGRSVASDERKAEIERIFLLGYRNLVKGIMQSDATTLGRLLKSLLGESSFLDDSQKMMVAYQVMKVSKGAFMSLKSSSDRTFANLFSDPANIKRNLQQIQLTLNDMITNREIERVVEKMDTAPSVLVSYTSRLGGKGKKRINLNSAHHIDLIDMFGGNSKEIVTMAKRLDSGDVFSSSDEFIAYAQKIGKGNIAQTMISSAASEISEAQKSLVDGFKKEKLYNHSFGEHE